MKLHFILWKNQLHWVIGLCLMIHDKYVRFREKRMSRTEGDWVRHQFRLAEQDLEGVPSTLLFFLIIANDRRINDLNILF